MKQTCRALLLLVLGADSLFAHGTDAKAQHACPETFIVELCFVVPQKYRDAFTTAEEMAVYLATMINSLILRFEDMQSPGISFQINDVAVTEDSRLVVFRNTTVDADQTLRKLAGHLKEGHHRICDVVIMLTSDAMVIKQGNEYKGVSGAAAAASVCTEGKVGIVHDKPHSYEAVRSLAHELAHTLGATHDGTGRLDRIRDHPSAVSCPPSEGYLMGNFNLGVKKYTLSNCSMEQIRAYYRTLSQDCIEVLSAPNLTSNEYPGRNMTPEKLCKLFRGDLRGLKPSNKNQVYQKCQIRCCTPLGGNRRTCTYHNMLEGMKCSGEMTCRRGVCGMHVWDEP